MFERLADLESEFHKLDARLSEIYASGDQTAARDAGKRHAELAPLVEAYAAHRSAERDLAEARELLRSEGDAEMREFLKAEIESLQARLSGIEAELKEMLLPRDPNDGRNVIVEIRGAEGGEEANLFARDLFQMYQRYADRQGWKLAILGSDASPMGGFNEISFQLRGPTAWTRMHLEGGPHRVQRVPVTESQGRVHTSSATVTVLPEAAEVDVQIDPGDLRVDVYRSSGPGGQSVNTTDSAVRITHVPTGLVVAMQDEKSQIQNRAKAMQVLRSRLLKLEQDKQNAELSATRRSQVGGGGRSEKIRTYNYKENRLTDHRIRLTIYSLDRVLGSGDLDEIVDGLLAAERAEQLGEGGAFGDGGAFAEGDDE
jgi:peptide chain release factor 1